MTDATPPLRTPIPPDPTRARLNAMIVERATNDAEVWALLASPDQADVDRGLAAVFGVAPPPNITVHVRVEDESTFFHVVSATAEPATLVLGPRSIAERHEFRAKVDYRLLTDPVFRTEFEVDAKGAVDDAFTIQFPTGVVIEPLVETSVLGDDGELQHDIFVVLPYAPHAALLGGPYSLLFDGIDGAVWVPASPSLDVDDGLTVEAWVRPRVAAATDAPQAIVSRAGPAAGWELAIDGAQPRFSITVDGTSHVLRPLSGTPDLVPGRWYHLVGVYDGETVRLDVDGSTAAAEPAQGPVTNDSGSLALGHSSQGDRGAGAYAGEIDEVWIMGRGITIDEVRYNRPRKRADPHPGRHEVRAHYPMSEGNGPVLRDHSSSHNDGTLATGAVWSTFTGGTP